MSKRVSGLFAAMAVAMVVLAGCGGSDSATTSTEKRPTTTAERGAQGDDGSRSTTTESTGGSSSDTGDVSVDEFCKNVKHLTDLVKDAKDNPSPSNVKAAADYSKDVAQQTAKLMPKLIQNKDLMKQYESCAQELAQAGATDGAG